MWACGTEDEDEDEGVQRQEYTETGMNQKSRKLFGPVNMVKLSRGHNVHCQKFDF